MQLPSLGLFERQLPIEEVLNRRSDLSTFVVHLTGEHGVGGPAKERLLSIIREQLLRAGTEPRGWARTVRHPDQSPVLDEVQRATQRVVSFSETPLEHIYSMFANIANRQVRLRPYGLALTKMVARRIGINPVWYVDLTEGHRWRIRTALNDLVKRSCREGWFDEVKDIFPLIEMMQTRRDDQGNVTTQVEFWWEREWGHIGDLAIFPVWNRIIWLCPEDEIPEIEASVRAVHDGPGVRVHCIDPNWGLERIIGQLAGFAPADMTPFGSR
jgi:hypothetical protein